MVDLVSDDQLGGEAPGSIGDRFGRPAAERCRTAAPVTWMAAPLDPVLLALDDVPGYPLWLPLIAWLMR